MKVILLQDVKGVGKKDQTINANEGYAKNFLFPKGLAVEANAGNVKRLDNVKKAEQLQKEQEYEAAKSLGDLIAEKTVTVNVKTGENGKLFGAVTNKEIAKALKEQEGIDVEKKKISLDEPIKEIGEKKVTVKLHPKVSVKLTVSIKEA
ncbi:MAG TPA: 50S ribosomal protein L9 [Lachnospiraceae bacterium]|nr:50S ribosomal protein L9 [Lachnospiraceae bacterium]